MKKYIYMAVAAIAALSSCSSDDAILNEGGQNETGVTKFTATIEDADATRATFNTTTKKAEWEATTDKINVGGAVYTAETSGATTTFTGTGATKGADEKYHAYFPASLYNSGTPTLPATQTYDAGKFNMPMYAESETEEFEFKNICAVLAVKVTSADVTTLKSIKVKADKALCGAFTVSENKAVLTDASDNTKTVELVSESALTLNETGTTFYIAIPAQEYKYLNIYLSEDGSTYKEAMATKKAAGLGAIARNTMYSINYEKNAVQLWADGPYFATMNIGAASETDYGNYFAWGGTIAYADGDGKSVGEGEYARGPENLSGATDTATQLWGSNWCMPSDNDFWNLLRYSDFTTTTYKWDVVNGVVGRKFTGKEAYSSNSVFFPTAGYSGYFSGTTVTSTGEYGYGYYWSSTVVPGNVSEALHLSIGIMSNNVTFMTVGANVMPVRAVLAE